MNFTDLKKTVSELKEKNNTQESSFYYLIGFLVLSSFYSLASAVPKMSDLATMIFSIVFSLVMTYLTFLYLRRQYRHNGADKGINFLDRLIALLWVTSIRAYPLIFIVFGVIIAVIPTGSPLQAFAGVLFIIASVLALIYQLLAVDLAFKEINQKQEAVAAETTNTLID